MKLQDNVLRNGILIAVIIGIITVVVIVLVSSSDSYSALYLEEYSSYVDQTVSFTYGVDRFGVGTTHSLDVIIGDETYHSESFEIGTWDTHSGKVDFGYQGDFPAKVQIVLREGDDEYTVHFWIDGEA